MNSLIKRTLAATTASLLLTASSANAINLIFEDWQDAAWINTDINSVDNAPLHDFIGYGLNDNNPTTLLNGGVGTGGNVLRDQGGFGGTYGVADNAGNAIRIRSSNGALLNKSPLQLATLGATSVTFSFDLKQVTLNYVQVVEYSTDQAFTTPVLLDTFDGLGTLGLWEAKSYTLVNGVDATFTDDFYFRIRKLRPNPAGTDAGSNPKYHTYDNISIDYTAGPAFDPADLDQDGDVDDADFGIAFAAFTGPGGVSASPADLDDDGDVDDADFGIAFAAFTGPGGGAGVVPEPTSLALLGLGGLMIARRRRA